MLVIIKSRYGTREAERGVKLARDEAADIVLMGDGVSLAGKDRLDGFCGTAHVLKDDLEARDVGELEKGVRVISREELNVLITEEEVLGTF